MQRRLYVVGRADLSPGLRAAQAGHAIASFALERPWRFRRWRNHYLILLEAADEQTLVALEEQARRRGFTTATWKEPDLDDQLTAFALAPSRRARKFCSNLPLLLHQCRVSGDQEVNDPARVHSLGAAPCSGSSSARASVSKTEEPGSAPGRNTDRRTEEVM